ncbi:type II toxin-antitoxin system RelB/DinJ family antitoxin [Candidatus Pacearchaeota archaeon]|nr:type II toxin-antitoxin system RelB/DinJ family antitoxin [Candidatus Pacearchaeota archaeon]
MMSVTVDGDLKQKATKIIQQMDSSMSYEVNQLLKKIVEEKGRITRGEKNG